MDIAKKVNDLIRKFGTRDPFEIAASLGAIVIPYPLVGVRGFYQYFQRNHIIYIDERLSKEDQRFVCAHELGHMILHKNANALFMDSRTHLNTSKYENDADRFAMNLLVPDDSFDELLEYPVSQLCLTLGYEERLIRLRLLDYDN